MSSVIEEKPTTPPIGSPVDAEVDIEIMKTVPKQFSICDEKSACWLVRRIVSAREYADRVKLWAQLELRRADREQLTLMFLFGRQIEAWTRAEIEKLGGKRKTIALPSGLLCLRSEKAKLIVDDTEAVLAWARRCLPTAIQKQESLIKSVLNEHFESSGELPDSGAHVEPAREKFRIS